MSVVNVTVARQNTILRRVSINELTGCWIWTGPVDKDGYAKCGLKGLSSRAARAMYELCVGPLQPGEHAHHKCENRRCVNPAHLEPQHESKHKGIHAAALTHCKHGHPYTEENTYRDKRGRRACATCRKIRGSSEANKAACKAYYQRTKEAVL